MCFQPALASSTVPGPGIATQNRGITSLSFANFGMPLLDSDAGTCADAGEPTSCLRMFANPKFQSLPGLARTSKLSGALQHR